MLQRFVGVFKLNSATFEEIEHNKALTTTAGLIVVGVSLLSGIGAGFLSQGSFFKGFIGSVLAVLLGWVVWSLVTWFVGTRLFQGQAEVDEMLRVIGFAYLPQVLGIIPCIGGIIGTLWTLAAGFIAVRQGLDLDNMKALFTIAIGFIGYVALTILLSSLFGGMGMLFGS